MFHKNHSTTKREENKIPTRKREEEKMNSKLSAFLMIIVAALLLSLAATTRIMKETFTITKDQHQQQSSSSSPSSSSSRRDQNKQRIRPVPSLVSKNHDNHQEEEDVVTTKAATPTTIETDDDHDNNHKNNNDNKKENIILKKKKVEYAKGRDTERSHHGLEVHPESGVRHASWWYSSSSSSSSTKIPKCHGTHKVPDCTTKEAYDYASRHILFVIVTGGEAVFRVELSDCTWLSKLPPDNVLVITDIVPHEVRTKHHWIRSELPEGMELRNGDFFSASMPKGYLHAVRKAGQGYGAGWIAAQTRFSFGLKYAAKMAMKDRKKDIRWVYLIDDDTIVQLDHLVHRVRFVNETAHPWYFSRRGWGGAGHLYSRRAVQILNERLHECEDRWFVRQFRASDTMLLKCAGHLKLRAEMEGTMSHCPAATRPEFIESNKQVSMHGKKDFYPMAEDANPLLMASWRLALYYLSMYCRSPKAIHDVVEWSACTYGASCKRSGCDAVADRRRAAKWKTFSESGSLRTLSLKKYIDDIVIPTRAAAASEGEKDE